MIAPPLILIGAIIIIALVFDFTNGFHDSANSISTVVSTKVLSPRNAVVFAAFFNFLAAFGFGVAVADTIASIVNLDVVGDLIIPYIVLAALAGAIRLEPDHLVLWPAYVIVSCAYRGPCRGWYLGSRDRCHQVVDCRAGRTLYGALAADRSYLRVPVYGRDPLVDPGIQ